MLIMENNKNLFKYNLEQQEQKIMTTKSRVGEQRKRISARIKYYKKSIENK